MNLIIKLSCIYFSHHYQLRVVYYDINGSNIKKSENRINNL